MLGTEISTEWPIHIYCSVQLVPHASHGKGQQEIAFESVADLGFDHRKKLRKFSVWGIKKGSRPLGGGRAGCALLDPLGFKYYL